MYHVCYYSGVEWSVEFSISSINTFRHSPIQESINWLIPCALFAFSLQQTLFNLDKPGHRLANSTVFDSLYNVTTHDCVRTCIAIERCKALSYDPVESFCMFHSMSSSEALSSDWVNDENYIFSDIAAVPTVFAGSCAQATCGTNDRCIPTTPPACLGYCGKAPSVENSLSVFSNTPQNVATAERIYSCAPSYNMTPYGTDGQAKVLCQSDGTWTTLSASCLPA